MTEPISLGPSHWSREWPCFLRWPLGSPSGHRSSNAPELEGIIQPACRFILVWAVISQVSLLASISASRGQDCTNSQSNYSASPQRTSNQNDQQLKAPMWIYCFIFSELFIVHDLQMNNSKKQFNHFWNHNNRLRYTDIKFKLTPSADKKTSLAPCCNMNIFVVLWSIFNPDKLLFRMA